MENIGEDSTWKEMERAIKKDGFREGAAKGSETSFQRGFDDGYIEGMRFGKLLGQHNGVKTFENGNVLDWKHGNCYICSKTPKTEARNPLPELIYTQSYQEVKNSQQNHNDRLAHSLS